MRAHLYFATNRNYKGNDRWKPKGYGKKFSSDGHFNLRFGKLALELEESKVQTHLTKKFDGNRVGDGEGLAAYIGKKMKNVSINAYQDHTAAAKKSIEFHANSSTHFFKDLKKDMEREADALIFIHGYNVSWEEAASSALSLQFMLNKDLKEGEKETIVVLFSWPSNGSMMPFAAYKSDRSDARDSGQAVGRALLKLKDFLAEVKPLHEDKSMRPCFNKVHLLAHSMGNYVLQNALTKIKGYSSGNRMPRIFEHIFLCAADVDDNCLEEGEKMGQLHDLCNHISIYHNKGDVAMYISDYTKGHPQRLGNAGVARPQLVHNKIQQINCSTIVRGIVEHSYYQWATVNDDIKMTIQEEPFESSERKRKGQSREWELY